MAAGPSGIEIKGLKEWRRDLRKCGAGWTRHLAALNRGIAKFVEGEAKGNWFRPVQVEAERAVRGVGTVQGARIGVGTSPPFAQGAVWGAKQYKQFPEWVGNNWEVGGAGGPYGINMAIRENKDEITESYADGFAYIAAVVAGAFPDGIPPKKPKYLKGPGTF